MKIGNIVNHLLDKAVKEDLDPVPARSLIFRDQEKTFPPRRPEPDECEVFLFPETWATTALGYPGLGGNSLTTAYTTIVLCRPTNSGVVYWGDSGVPGKVASYQEIKALARVCSTHPASST